MKSVNAVKHRKSSEDISTTMIIPPLPSVVHTHGSHQTSYLADSTVLTLKLTLYLASVV